MKNITTFCASVIKIKCTHRGTVNQYRQQSSTLFVPGMPCDFWKSVHWLKNVEKHWWVSIMFNRVFGFLTHCFHVSSTTPPDLHPQPKPHYFCGLDAADSTHWHNMMRPATSPLRLSKYLTDTEELKNVQSYRVKTFVL